MDATMIEEHLENIDRRLTPLATKAELAAAITPLATKGDIHELRRHMELLIEDQRSDTRLLAEHLAVVMSRLPDR